jgi:hypothetical protein
MAKINPKLLAQILAAPPLRLSDLQPGDKVRGFEHWGCIPTNATRTVRADKEGLFLLCRGPDGALPSNTVHHYLDGQCDSEGILVGMICVEEWY